MEKVTIDNVIFYNFRKLAEAKREVGEDASLEDLIAAYEKRAGNYVIAEKKTPKKTVKKTVKRATKKTTKK